MTTVPGTTKARTRHLKAPKDQNWAEGVPKPSLKGVGSTGWGGERDLSGHSECWRDRLTSPGSPERKAPWSGQKDPCSISKAVRSYFRFPSGETAQGEQDFAEICLLACAEGLRASRQRRGRGEEGGREEGWTKVEEKVGMEGRGCLRKAFWRSDRTWWLTGNPFLIILSLRWPVGDAADSGRPSIDPSPGSVVAMAPSFGLKDQMESLADAFLLHSPGCALLRPRELL